MNLLFSLIIFTKHFLLNWNSIISIFRNAYSDVSWKFREKIRPGSRLVRFQDLTKYWILQKHLLENFTKLQAWTWLKVYSTRTTFLKVYHSKHLQNKLGSNPFLGSKLQFRISLETGSTRAILLRDSSKLLERVICHNICSVWLLLVIGYFRTYQHFLSEMLFSVLDVN